MRTKWANQTKLADHAEVPHRDMQVMFCFTSVCAVYVSLEFSSILTSESFSVFRRPILRSSLWVWACNSAILFWRWRSFSSDDLRFYTKYQHYWIKNHNTSITWTLTFNLRAHSYTHHCWIMPFLFIFKPEYTLFGWYNYLSFTKYNSVHNSTDLTYINRGSEIYIPMNKSIVRIRTLYTLLPDCDVKGMPDKNQPGNMSKLIPIILKV